MPLHLVWLLLLLLLLLQDEVETTIAADVVNQYIWRGQDLGNNFSPANTWYWLTRACLDSLGSVGISQPEGYQGV